MATISIDIDSSKNEIYLIGDINALKSNRFAWHYVQDCFHPTVELDKIIIAIGQQEPITALSKIRNMLSKYGFGEKQTETSEKILLDFYEEENKFSKFSQNALQIRNNYCDYDEFKRFSDTVDECFPTRKLYSLQLLSAYHLAFSQNACNFSVPGAGKTSIVYGAYAYLHSLLKNDVKYVDHLLVVGPLSSFGPWEAEYQECFGREPRAKRLIGGVSREEKTNYLYSKRPAELTLISYASVVSLQRELGYFLRYNKVMIVLDEAHKIKNTADGVTAQAILSLAKYGQSRVVLTGTPAPNGYQDLYNMFKFIWPSKNVIGFEVNQLRDMTGRGDTDRVDRLINNISPYFVRIKKSDLHIPPATIHPPILVPMGTYQQRIYDYIEKKYIDAMMSEGDMDASTQFRKKLANARVTRLAQAATDPTMLQTPLKEFFEDDESPREAFRAIDDSEFLKSIMEYGSLEVPAKYIVVRDLVKQIISKNGKVVIWATFIHTILGLKSYLEENGIACQELYGAIPVEQDDNEASDNEAITREHIVREFQLSDCPYKVIIANPFAVAESISLHKACHNAIYIERSFNAAHFVQSKDRIHRYGLAESIETNYYYVLSQNSIDESINTRLSEKERRMTEIMESMPIPLFDNVEEDLGDEDIKALIRDYVRRTKKS